MANKFPRSGMTLSENPEIKLFDRAFNSMLNPANAPTVYPISLPHITAEPIYEFSRDVANRIIRRQQTEGIFKKSVLFV